MCAVVPLCDGVYVKETVFMVATIYRKNALRLLDGKEPAAMDLWQIWIKQCLQPVLKGKEAKNCTEKRDEMKMYRKRQRNDGVHPL